MEAPAAAGVAARAIARPQLCAILRLGLAGNAAASLVVGQEGTERAARLRLNRILQAIDNK
jgi:hypothetical protein